MTEMYTKIVSKYTELGLAKPSYQELLKQSIHEITTPGLTVKQYESEERFLAKERKELRELERKLASLSNNFTDIKIPKIHYHQTSWYAALFLNVVIPAVFQLLLVYAIWTFIVYRSGKIVDDEHLANFVKDVPIYSIKQSVLKPSVSEAVPIKAITYQPEEDLEVETVTDSTQKDLVKSSSVHLPAKLSQEMETSFDLDDLITNLLSKAQEKEQKIFVCTSATEELPNVQLIINFGAALAKFSPKVLLIDAAFRSHSVSNYFEMSQYLGLSDYISRKSKILDCIHSTNINNLSVLPVGKERESASKLLFQSRFDQALKSFINRFDFVLISSGALDTDPTAKILAKKLDGVYLVANQESNTLAVIQEALLKLQDVDVKANGVIFQTTIY